MSLILNEANLARRKTNVSCFNLRQKPLQTGIVHIGLGAFFRAHLCWYTDLSLQQQPGNWLISAANLRSNTVSRQLAKQNHLFSVNLHRAKALNSHIVSCLQSAWCVREDYANVLQQLCAQKTKIISLTITEKGYYLSPQSHQLDFNNQDIISDLNQGQHCKTAIGLITRALQYRHHHNLPGVTLLSCDNLPNNGKLLEQAVISFATEFDTDLVPWIVQNVTFPCTMVDRIVPAVNTESTTAIADNLGLTDNAGVITEDYSQWVVEDNFVAGRPAWQRAGVLFSEEVPRFEQMKLRLLNGAHSALAYLGCLAQIPTVAACMQRAELRRFIIELMRKEIAPTVIAPKDYSLNHYIDQLIARFDNVQLQHRCSQIASDGSQKIPQRLLPVIEQRLKQQLDVSRLTIAVAAWIVFNAKNQNLSDPLRDLIKQSQRIDNSQELAGYYLNLKQIFPSYLQQHEAFALTLATSIEQLRTLPPIEVLRLSRP